MKKLIVLATALIVIASLSSEACAQQDAKSKKEPPLPPTLQTMVQEGAQVRFMGREGSLDGWMAIRNGQEQYFYTTADGKYIMMGLLFDSSGKMITLQQVRKIQEEGGEILDMLAADTPAPENKLGSESVASVAAGAAASGNVNKAFKSPAEQMFSDIESSNWVSLGNPAAPIVYSFMDPQCPHCHEFIKELRKDYIQNGLVQVRMIPVGFKDETRAQAALLLAVPNAQERWFRHIDGDAEALPVTQEINDQGVQRNLSIMQNWKFNVTPLTVYRSRDGGVKIVQGRVKNMRDFLADISPTN